MEASIDPDTSDSRPSSSPLQEHCSMFGTLSQFTVHIFPLVSHFCLWSNLNTNKNRQTHDTVTLT